MTKIIQTKYNGYYFRSRTEARWAVYFDAVGLKYEYEPEGFLIDIQGEITPYLPDFHLLDLSIYIEIKNEEFENSKEYDDTMWKLLHFENDIALIAGPPKPGVKLKHPVWIYDGEKKTTEWEIEESFFSNSGSWYIAWYEDKGLDENWYLDKNGLEAARSARFEFDDRVKCENKNIRH